MFVRALTGFYLQILGGAMKAPLGRKAIERHFYLIIVLLLAAAALNFSISAAQEQARQSTDQAASNPSAVSEGGAQQAQPAQQATDQTTVPQAPDVSAPQPGAASMNCSPEYALLVHKTASALMTPDFTFVSVKALDPFVPFITLETSTEAHPEEDSSQAGFALTPLQKMTMSEIERGLKAITWGQLGSRAVIEDSTGRGYIVSIGTPAGEHGGVITQILSDRLVIQQEIYDRLSRKRSPREFTVKLAKKTENK